MALKMKELRWFKVGRFFSGFALQDRVPLRAVISGVPAETNEEKHTHVLESFFTSICTCMRQEFTVSCEFVGCFTGCDVLLQLFYLNLLNSARPSCSSIIKRYITCGQASLRTHRTVFQMKNEKR